MHAANIYAENYSNDKKSQVNNTWRSHPPTANSTYQQLRAAARLFVARIPLARRPRSARTYQTAHNR